MDKVILDKKIPNKVFITVYTEVECPICAIAKERLEWLAEEFYPHIIVNSPLLGSPFPDIKEGTMLHLQHMGYNFRADQTCREFSSTEGGKVTPVTVINGKYRVHGTDLFKNQLENFLIHEPVENPMDHIAKTLSREEAEALSSGYLDGLDYTDWIHDNVIYPETGMANSGVLDELRKRKEMRDKIFDKISMEVQKDGFWERGKAPASGM